MSPSRKLKSEQVTGVPTLTSLPVDSVLAVRVFKEMQTHLVSCCGAWLCGAANAPACASAPQSKHGLSWLAGQCCCLGAGAHKHGQVAVLLLWRIFDLKLWKHTLTPLTWVFPQCRMLLMKPTNAHGSGLFMPHLDVTLEVLIKLAGKHVNCVINQSRKERRECQNWSEIWCSSQRRVYFWSKTSCL